MKTKLLARSLLGTLILTFSVSFSALANSGGDKGVSPQHAFDSLKAGNQRFVEGKSQDSKRSATRRGELTAGQKPFAIVLSCSDSRVPPELVFDQGLGEIFTVRVAGHALGAGTVASIEYAVEHLGSRLLVVMGHEACGAVKAALTTPAGQSAGSADLDTLVSSITPGLEGTKRDLASDDKTLRKPVKSNVDYTTQRLLERSSIVRKKVEAGELKIVKGIYGLGSGKVDFWGWD